MISGAMPRWRIWFHRLASALMSVLLFTVGLVPFASILRRPPADNPGASPVPTILIGLFALAALVGAISVSRTGRKVIREFQYDGQELRFRTLGQAEESWRIEEIKEVRESRGRAPGIGYRLNHHDGRYVILDYTIPTSWLAVAQMQHDLAVLNIKRGARPRT